MKILIPIFTVFLVQAKYIKSSNGCNGNQAGKVQTIIYQPEGYQNQEVIYVSPYKIQDRQDYSKVTQNVNGNSKSACSCQQTSSSNPYQNTRNSYSSSNTNHVEGKNDQVYGKYNEIKGDTNGVVGQSNLVVGSHNYVMGQGNIVLNNPGPVLHSH